VHMHARRMPSNWYASRSLIRTHGIATPTFRWQRSSRPISRS